MAEGTLVVIRRLSFCDTCDKVFDHRPQRVLWSTIPERVCVVTCVARWNVDAANFAQAGWVYGLANLANSWSASS